MASYKDFVQVGEHILLEMQCGDVFDGNTVNVGQNLFELVNVRQHDNPNKLQGIYTFYRTEIKRIFKLQTEIKSNIKKSNNSEFFHISKLHIDEFEYLRQISEKFIYLENADSRYYQAVKDIENSETIGIIPLGMDKSMMTDVKLLGICTTQQVYLFDLAGVNRSFYPELKQIFESKFICKVFHGGMPFIDILFKNYEVYVSNIFDTQLTDLIIEKARAKGKSPRRTRSLAYCLPEYLKLPSSILKKADQISWKTWSERPLTDNQKLCASQLCTYLMKLQQIMKQILLERVFKTINTIHNHVYALNDLEFGIYAGSNKVTEDINSLLPVLKEYEDENNIT